MFRSEAPPSWRSGCGRSPNNLQAGHDRLFAEDVANQTGCAVIVELPAVESDDTRGLLAACCRAWSPRAAWAAHPKYRRCRTTHIPRGTCRGRGRDVVECRARRGYIWDLPVYAIKDNSLRRFGIFRGLRGRRCRGGRRNRTGVRIHARPLQTGPKPVGSWGSTKLAISLIIGKWRPPRRPAAGAGSQITIKQEGGSSTTHAIGPRSGPQDPVRLAQRARLDRPRRALVSITRTIRAPTKTTSIEMK